MKIQTNTQTQPAKKLALKKQTIRLLAKPQQHAMDLSPTADC